MKQVAYAERSDLYKIEIISKPYGVEVFIYRSPNSQFPEEDYLDGSIEMAKRRCAEDFGVSSGMWR